MINKQKELDKSLSKLEMDIERLSKRLVNTPPENKAQMIIELEFKQKLYLLANRRMEITTNLINENNK